jgi:hypothetical protein
MHSFPNPECSCVIVDLKIIVVPLSLTMVPVDPCLSLLTNLAKYKGYGFHPDIQGTATEQPHSLRSVSYSDIRHQERNTTITTTNCGEWSKRVMKLKV